MMILLATYGPITNIVRMFASAILQLVIIFDLAPYRTVLTLSSRIEFLYYKNILTKHTALLQTCARWTVTSGTSTYVITFGNLRSSCLVCPSPT
jgi:hypothetical protein